MQVSILLTAGTDIGLGHLYRMSYLSKHLVQKNITVNTVVICEDDKLTIGFDCLCFTNTTKALEYLEAYDQNLIIFDLYTYTHDILSFIASRKGKNIVFGLNKGSYLNVNYIINVAQKNDYVENKEVIGNTCIYSGAVFAIQPPNIDKFKNNYIFKNKVSSICIVFGGSDPSGLTLKTTKCLTNYFKDIKITIRLSRNHKDYVEIDQYIRSFSNITLITHFSNVYDFFGNHDLLITSPGNLLFEAGYYGIPTLAFVHSKKQKADFKYYLNVFGASTLTEKLRNLECFVTDKEFWRDYYSNMNVGSSMSKLTQIVEGAII